MVGGLASGYKSFHLGLSLLGVGSGGGVRIQILSFRVVAAGGGLGGGSEYKSFHLGLSLLGVGSGGGGANTNPFI